MPKPLIIAHRGDTKNAPENTLPAFASAIQQGTDGIELDVHWSKDEHLVVHHFFGYEGTASEYNLIFEKPLAEIKRVDVGSRFSPAFSGCAHIDLIEVLDLGKGKVRFEIDMKGSSLPFYRLYLQKSNASALRTTSN
ncbi:MAG: glycerophosphodiester phosphodiesterase family protein [Caldilineaceae bacterium]